VSDPTEEEPPVSSARRWAVALVSLGYLTTSSLNVADFCVAFASPLAASPEPREIMGSMFWLFVWLASAGVYLGKDLARRLLVGLLALHSLRLGLMFAMVASGGSGDTFGWVLGLGAMAFQLLIVATLHASADLTPVPAPPISAGRLLTLGAALLLSLGLVATDHLISEPSPDLAELPRTSQGELDVLRAHERWEGARQKVTGVVGGRPQTEEIGPWNLRIVPVGEDVVIVEGLYFARNFEVKLDLARNALVLHDTLFLGRPLSGNSPMFGEMAFTGVVFEGDGGRIHGKASILVLADGRVALDFDKVFVDGRRSREYGAVRPVTVVEELPLAPAEETPRPDLRSPVFGPEDEGPAPR
jgi:hypothetical protein